jgi:hypothetical protein
VSRPRPRPLAYKVIHHDCEWMTHSYRILGPFTSREAAESFIEQAELETPLDGGYAFAAVAIAFPDEEMESPDEEEIAP